MLWLATEQHDAIASSRWRQCGASVGFCLRIRNGAQRGLLVHFGFNMMRLTAREYVSMDIIYRFDLVNFRSSMVQMGLQLFGNSFSF
mmetsp:Transcript_388/g.710  ORF Transcript_388/g.710 Transcript_388/m.710 type:complete len:87 (-) Transcript_388:562-822(-)